MNNLLPYEEQIAGKLAELPLPPLEDVIWARIETMLDAADAVENNETPEDQIINDPTAIKTIFTKKTIISLVIIAILVTIILIRKQKNEKPQRQLPTITTPATKLPANKEQPDSVFSKPVLPDVQKRKIKADDIKAQSSDLPDTATSQLNLIVNPPVIDSFAKKQLPVLQPVKKDSVLQKPKGVSGISDSDYRIKTQKKDSINN